MQKHGSNTNRQQQSFASTWKSNAMKVTRFLLPLSLSHERWPSSQWWRRWSSNWPARWLATDATAVRSCASSGCSKVQLDGNAEHCEVSGWNSIWSEWFGKSCACNESSEWSLWVTQQRKAQSQRFSSRSCWVPGLRGGAKRNHAWSRQWRRFTACSKRWLISVCNDGGF